MGYLRKQSTEEDINNQKKELLRRRLIVDPGLERWQVQEIYGVTRTTAAQWISWANNQNQKKEG